MKSWFTYWLGEINIIFPYMEYEVVDKNEGTMNGNSWEEIS